MRTLAKKGWVACLVILIVTLLCAADGIDGVDAVGKPSQKELRFDQRFGRDASGNISLLGKDRPDRKLTNVVTETSILSKLKDDDVFIDYGNGERITWGALHEHLDKGFKDKISNLLTQPDASGELGVRMYQQAISKVLQLYTKTQVVASEARKLGFEVKAEDFQTELERIRKAKPELAQDVFQLSFISNALLQRAYVREVIGPKIKIPDEAINKLIAKRHQENLSVPLTNALFRTQAESVRARIQNKEISFAEAAESYSECTQCSSDNGDCGTWYADDTEIDPILVKATFALSTNVLSQVIETPAAYHIVRLESRYDPDKKADSDEVASAEVRHIQIDKWQVEDEYTPETARLELEKRVKGRILKRCQYELIGKAEIKCVVPLKTESSRGQTRIFK